jgi:hypothetical protein
MKKLLAPVLGLVVASPAYAVSIVSLHGGMTLPFASTDADFAMTILGLAALSVVVAFRALKRKPGSPR